MIVFLTIGLLAEAQVISDKTEAGLKGPVSICETFTYKAVDKFGDLEMGDLVEAEAFGYDSKGFKTMRAVSSEHYKYYGKFVNTYNAAGKIEVIDEYNAKGELIGRNKFTYSATKVVEAVYGDGQGSSDYQGEKIWTKGKLVDNASMFKFTYFYNANNQVIKGLQKTFYGGESVWTYTYNAKGALASVTSPGGKRTYSNYEYDEKGNWILRVEYHDGKPTEIPVRKIKY